MNTTKLACLATTALVGNILVAASAYAQSTGTTSFETVVVTGSTGPATVSGAITEETVSKIRTTIDQEFIETQVPGQTILQTLSVVTPGLVFTNDDPYGSSGGRIRLHGFDGNRIALTFDGMPLNDTGNYAVFTNQLLDGELISKAQVNTGSTDSDSPTAASTGGTINFASRTPSNEFGGFGQATIGEFNYHRYLAFIESGEIGPWGTKGWAALSFQEYDKYKGKGDIEKWQFNTKLYQPIGENGDFISAAVHYNQNRNNASFGPNLATLNADGSIRTLEEVLTAPKGYELDFNTTYNPIITTTRAGFAGDIDVEPSTGPNNANYFGLRINPSNTGNLRIQSKFSLGDRITLTVDPSFQYVLANGGTQNTTVWESCNGSAAATNPANGAANCPIITRQLLGTIAPASGRGADLNGDGDVNDLVRVMNPSNTNTRRVGVLSSLIWEVTDDQLVRLNYAYDRGSHRQTGEYGYINGDNTYASWFGGKEGEGRKIDTVDGASYLRARDRHSFATLNQISAEYRGSFFDDALSLNIGLRAPFFERELNQYCYSQAGSSNVRCTSETPVRTLTSANNVTVNGLTTYAAGNVQFAETAAPNPVTGAPSGTQYIAPYSKKVKYDDLLPNVGASWFFGDSQLFGNYSESTSLPRTDSLYTVFRLADNSIGNPDLVPETSQTFEGGYRYSANNIIATASVWSTNFQNRILSTFDETLGFFIDRNVGDVEQMGVDLAVGWSPAEELSLYLSTAYNDSELQQDIVTGRTSTTVNGVTTFTALTAPTKGKTLVETPEWTWTSRVEYRPTPYLQFGGQVKFVGDRWVTDVNDLATDAYTVTDLDARIDLEELANLKNSSISVNVSNLFDADYYGSINGTQTSATFGANGFGTPFATVGSPRTFNVTLRAGF